LERCEETDNIIDSEITSLDLKLKGKDHMEIEDGEFEEKLPKKLGRKTTRVEREDTANRDKLMGTQTMIDKTLGVRTKTSRISASNVPQKGGGPKSSSK